MEFDNAVRPSSDAQILCRKCWTAYVWLVLCAPVLTAVLWSVSAFLPTWGLLGVSALCFGFFVYWWLTIRSVFLFFDDNGVWLYSGVFPWSRGVKGVKWRDLDEGTYDQSFFSWVLRSYTIRLSHRFTKESEVLLTRMYNGHKAIVRVNELHRLQGGGQPSA